MGKILKHKKRADGTYFVVFKDGTEIEWGRTLRREDEIMIIMLRRITQGMRNNIKQIKRDVADIKTELGI